MIRQDFSYQQSCCHDDDDDDDDDGTDVYALFASSVIREEIHASESDVQFASLMQLLVSIE